ncbi:MAG: TolC family protein [Planctomycetota bacterium]|nr:TolC family protein [Planctomycetota bacterium]
MTRCRSLFHLFCAAVFASAVGCGNARLGGPFSEWIDRDWPPDELAQPGSDQTGEPIASAWNSARYVEIPDEAGPEDYVRLVLQRNPALQAAAQKVRRLAERIDQVTALDDPQWEFGPTGRLGSDGSGVSGLTTEIRQHLPSPGKLATRGRIAAHEVAMAAQEMVMTRQRLIANTRRAYWSLYIAQRSIEVTMQSLDLLIQLDDVAENRYRTGEATLQDVLLVSTQRSRLDTELLAFRSQQEAAAAMLNNLLDRPIAAKVPAPGPAVATLEGLDLELDPLLASAMRVNPDLLRIHEQIAADRERLNLARLARWPDYKVEFGYDFIDDVDMGSSSEDEQGWHLTLELNLPIWSRKLDAAEAEALRAIFQSTAELRDAGNRTAFKVRDALVRAQTHHRQAILFRDEIIPKARQTLDVSTTDYQLGHLDFQAPIDNWRRLLTFELMYHQNIARLEQALADLQAALGEDLNRKDRSSDQPAVPGRGPPAELETKR